MGYTLAKMHLKLLPTGFFLKSGQRGIQMIDAMYNYRQGEIHSAEFSDELNKLCIPFENSLNDEQIDVFHQILDCVSDTAAAEMKAAYKAGFKDGEPMMQEIQV